MTSSDKRSEPRRKVCVQAFAADVNDTFDLKCIIRDVSMGGCMIVTSSVNELPDLIQLIPEGFDKPLAGKIVWRGEKFAGVSFISSNDDAVQSEVRDYFLDVVSNTDESKPLNVTGFVRPLSYSDRMARHDPRAK